jgi:serine/threonine protein kinase/Tol biopolymer transport system component
MPLTPGTRLGQYEIVKPLGAGGMGEVYRARDIRLGREVALKVLPPDLAADRSRRERFEHEARHVGALNHPNILVVYDIGADADVPYMATELIDGESLRGATLSPRKALDVAAQIADALSAAHAAGVTHRDLKPENVMVTHDGRAKLLDFGVAKASRTGAADVTVGQTDVGSVVGTVGYMAPEQVRGAAIDHRTDIFAFGALLYELLSGRRAFDGDTGAETMTAILKQDPPELPAAVNPAVRQIVNRCLEKKPDERFQSARDLAFALRQAAGESSSSQSLAPVRDVGPRRRRVRILLAMLSAAIAGVAVTLSLIRARDADIDPIRLTRFSSDLRTDASPAFSPDGRAIAYLRIGTATELLVQTLDAPAAVTLVTSTTSLGPPVWTADGNRICYTSLERDLMCVSAAGGTPQRLLRDVTNPEFSGDGRVLAFIRVVQQRPAVFISTPPGSEPTHKSDVVLGAGFVAQALSPDGSKLVSLGESSATVIPLNGGTPRSVPLIEGTRPWAVAWWPDNRHIVMSQISRPNFTLTMVDTESTARRLIHRDSGAISTVAVSADGARVAYSSGLPEWDIEEFTMDGARRRAVASSSNMDRFASWSSRGDRIVFFVGGPGRPASIWTADAERGAPQQLIALAAGSLATSYAFSPDGARIAYLDLNGINTLSSSGGRPVQVLASTQLGSRVCWSPDGEWIWFTEEGATLRKVPSLGGDATTVATAVGAVLDCSPDGRWISGAGRAGYELISTDGKERRVVGAYRDYAPRADNTMQFGDAGRVLYLLALDRRSIVTLDTATGQRRPAVTFQLDEAEVIQGFAVHPDGKRVLLTTGLQRDDIWLAEGFAPPATGWRRLISHWRTNK